jgi:hypothetical protein
MCIIVVVVGFIVPETRPSNLLNSANSLCLNNLLKNVCLKILTAEIIDLNFGTETCKSESISRHLCLNYLV